MNVKIGSQLASIVQVVQADGRRPLKTRLFAFIPQNAIILATRILILLSNWFESEVPEPAAGFVT
ncbi:hypothetical protein AUR64_03935 [Haloprofundus marisrubri]|uniref:Uncharacterized protein n=1 Tax=Haloprofundus marisrubri TaxID=1514971 RepID=A0A0W1RE48_9EURY|nr:hypothetical protein AUR64_03935 [Haloprofundus marisrubri]